MFWFKKRLLACVWLKNRLTINYYNENFRLNIQNQTNEIYFESNKKNISNF